MAGTAIDKKTMAICYTQTEVIVEKIKRVTDESIEIIRFLTSQGIAQAIGGGDGDIVLKALRSGVTVLEGIQEMEKKDILEPLDQKISDMRTVTSDTHDIQSTDNALKENANVVASLKR